MSKWARKAQQDPATEETAYGRCVAHDLGGYTASEHTLSTLGGLLSVSKMLPVQQQLNCRHSASNKLSRNTYCHFVRPTVRHVPCSTWHNKCCPPTVTAAAAPTPGHLQQPHGSISRTADASQQYSMDSSIHGSWWSRLDWELLLLASALPVPSALAEEGLTYDSSRGEGIVKTLSGGLYIGLLLYFLFKVLNRRARKAREEVRQLSPAVLTSVAVVVSSGIAQP